MKIKPRMIAPSKRRGWCWVIATCAVSIISIRLNAQVCTAANPGAPVTRFTSIVVFGDSLSDTGNVLATSTRAFGGIGPRTRPVPAYYDNSSAILDDIRPQGRWTNGRALNSQPNRIGPTAFAGVWHEALACRLGISPALPSEAPFRGNNFAYGGATTENSTGGFPWYVANVRRQVESLFLYSRSPRLSSYELYCVWGGGNDVRDAIIIPRHRGLFDIDTPIHTAAEATEVGTTAASNCAAAIAQLAVRARTQGTRIFVLWPNVVPMQHIPDFANRYGGSQLKRSMASIACGSFRREWRRQIGLLSTAHGANLTIIPLDLWESFSDIFSPGGAGGLNIEDPLLDFNGFSERYFAPGPNFRLAARSNPDKFVFWDKVHPTAMIHDRIAAEAYAAIRANDDVCASSEAFDGANAFSTLTATTSPEATDCAMTNDVWFYYYATAGGFVRFDTCATTGFDTVLSAYTGNCVNLRPVFCNDNHANCGDGTASTLSYRVRRGEYCLIRVGGKLNNRGTGTLTITPPAPPANDNCAGAILVQDGVTLFENGAATDNPNDPSHGLCTPKSDIWFRYAAAGGPVRFGTCGSEFATRIAVYDGAECPGRNAQPIACASSENGCDVVVPTLAGRTYWVRVGGNDSSTGAGRLSITPERRAECPCDWNADFVVDSGDLIVFLDAFFRREADYDNSGESTSEDFFEFITCLLTGCP